MGREKGEGVDGESLREWDGCDEGGVEVYIFFFLQRDHIDFILFLILFFV